MSATKTADEAWFVPKVEKAPDWSPDTEGRIYLVDGVRVVLRPGEVFRVLIPGTDPPRYFYPPEPR